MPLVYDYGSEVTFTITTSNFIIDVGGLSFLLIPFILMVKNIFQGNVKSISDLRMFWHSTVMPLEKVQSSHVWLLTSMIEMPNGETKALP